MMMMMMRKKIVVGSSVWKNVGHCFEVEDRIVESAVAEAHTVVWVVHTQSMVYAVYAVDHRKVSTRQNDS